MVYKLSCGIKFYPKSGNNPLVVDNPISVECEKNLKNEENFCTITLSKNIYGEISLNDDTFILDGYFHDFGVVKKTNSTALELGNYVVVNLGYNGSGIREFEGFINNINLDGDVVTIQIQDYSYILKKLVLDLDTKTRVLEEIGNLIESKTHEYININYQGNIIPRFKITYVFPDFKIHNFKLAKANGLDVLKYFRDKFIIDSFLDSNILHLNYALDQNAFTQWNENNTPVFTLVSDRYLKGADVLLEAKIDKPDLVRELPIGYNYILASQNLKYQYGEEILRKYIIKSISPRTGKETKIEIGNDGGDKHTIVLTPDNDEYTEDDLRKMYSSLALKYTYTGFKKGSTFTTYGAPSINLYIPVAFVGVGFKDESNTPFQIAQATAYLVTGKKVTFGVNGYRQEIEIGIKLELSGSIFNEDVFFTSNNSNKIKGTDLSMFDGTQKLFLS